MNLVSHFRQVILKYYFESTMTHFIDLSNLKKIIYSLP